MKLKHICFSLFAMSLLLNLTSCDGSGQDGTTNADTDNLVAESLPELVVGDTINYTTSDNTAPTLGNVTFNANSRATVGKQIYDYAKTGQYTFTIARGSTEDVTTIFNTALDNTLSDNGTNSQLGSRFRDILHRDAAIFTPDELREISAILAPSGTSTSVTADGILVARLNDQYTQLVTSTKLQQFQGTMAGTYYLDSNIVDIGFRKPSNSEITNYRFISSRDWIPFVTGKTSLFQKIARGTWTLELQNSTK